MTISLEKQSFSFVRAEEVHLRYSSCKATENGTHVTISTLLNDCGTSVNETQDALLFWNELRVDAVIIDGVITRSHDIRLPFYCSYSRKKVAELVFQSAWGLLWAGRYLNLFLCFLTLQYNCNV